MVKIFVYGTLRKGCGNYYAYLEGKSKFIGKGKTKEKYAMYADVIPYVVKNKRISNIVGEVYDVSYKVLKDIDGLEGHPYWYRREKIGIILDSGEEIDAWIYFYTKDVSGCRLVKSGDYIEYLRAREI